MKRWLLVLPLGLILSVVLLGVKQGRVAASPYTYCDTTVWPATCLYFTSSSYPNAGEGNAGANVLPDYPPGYSKTNPVISGVGPALYHVNSASQLITMIKTYLYSSDYQSQVGAAFIVDEMLSYNGDPTVPPPGGATDPTEPVGGGVPAGVGYAQNKSNFTYWSNLVNYYAANKNGYSINWIYKPDELTFCGTPSNLHVDSAYDPNKKDAVLFPIDSSGYNAKSGPVASTTCDYEYQHSMPMILFLSPSGSFGIGSLCGNVEFAMNPIVLSRPPSGSIAVQCSLKSNPNPPAQQIVTFRVDDPDGSTDGYFVVSNSGWVSAKYPSGSLQTVTILPPPTTDPYTKWTITLYAKDVGPGTSNPYVQVTTVKTDTPCVSVGCSGMTIDPAEIDPYMSFALTANVTASASPAPAGTFSITITKPGGGTLYSKSEPSTTNGALASATFSGIGPAGSVGTYGVSWTFTAGSVSQSCSGPLPVVYLPYLNIYGGDASAGTAAAYVGATGSSSCDTNTSGGIFSWNNHGAAGYPGAGAQYAVQALAAIEDFASALSSTNTPPAGLSFANTYTPPDPSNLNPTAGLFGGYFGAGTGDCDFTSDLAGAQTTNLDKTFGATTVTGNDDVWFVKNADVYISGNIIYANSGGVWTNVSSIPYFKLVVVGGNIYIQNTVSQLDGIYVAEPLAGNGGIIYTCSSAIRAPVAPTTPGSYTTCNNKLLINGAFVASRVEFGRTAGSIGQAQASDSLASNHDAEVFNYTPEIWLPRNSSSAGNGYTAITGLPPVL